MLFSLNVLYLFILFCFCILCLIVVIGKLLETIKDFILVKRDFAHLKIFLKKICHIHQFAICLPVKWCVMPLYNQNLFNLPVYLYAFYGLLFVYFRAKVNSRELKVPSFYLDIKELGNYWGCDEGPRRWTLILGISLKLFSVHIQTHIS